MRNSSIRLTKKVFCGLWVLILFAAIMFSSSLIFSSNHFRDTNSKLQDQINAVTRKLADGKSVNIQTMVAVEEKQEPSYSFSPTGRTYNQKYYHYVNVTTLLPLAKIPLHMLSKEKQYKDRMLNLRERCQNFPTDKFTSVIDLKRFVYDKGHDTIMCIVPKNACTTWKTIMMYLMGSTTFEKWTQINSRHLDLDYGSIKSMTRTPLSAASSLFNNMTKFMVTRHPFDRLVSAFISKFGKGQTPYRYSRGRLIARNGLKKFLGPNCDFSINGKTKNETIRKLTLSAQFTSLSESDKKYVLDLADRAFIGNITFEEFLRYAIISHQTSPRGFDVHWRPQHMLCNPCAINFDFIVRFENLGDDSKRILDYLQRFDAKEKRIEFPSSRSPAVTHSVAKEYFKNIPQQVIESVKRIYKKDFYYFNYHPDRY